MGTDFLACEVWVMSGYRSREERGAVVAAWRASGQSARAYCETRDFSTSSLVRWASEAKGARKPGTAAVEFVRVAMVPSRTGAIIVDIGRARICVERGFDAGLLREVVKALSEGAS